MNTYNEVMKALNNIGDKLFCEVGYQMIKQGNISKVKLYDENKKPIKAILLLESTTENDNGTVTTHILAGNKEKLLLYKSNGICIKPNITKDKISKNIYSINEVELINSDYKFDKDTIFSDKTYKDIFTDGLIINLCIRRREMLDKEIKNDTSNIDKVIKDLKGIKKKREKELKASLEKSDGYKLNLR